MTQYININRRSLITIGGYLAAGYGFATTCSDESDGDDTSSLSWTADPVDPPTPRSDMGTSTINDQMYVVGGRNDLGGGNGESYMNSIEAYDMRLDEWDTSHPPMPTARKGLVAAAVDDIIYAIGGRCENGNLPVVEAYDTVGKEWLTNIAPMPTARRYPTVGVINGKIYVVGGYDGDDFISTVEVFNPETGEWGASVSDAPFDTSEAVHPAPVIDGKLYLIGGNDDNGRVGKIASFDPVMGQWTFKSELNVPRVDSMGAVLDGKAYVMGGSDSAGELVYTVEVYDPSTGELTVAENLPTGREVAAAGSDGNSIHVIGGHDEGDGGFDMVNVNEKFG